MILSQKILICLAIGMVFAPLVWRLWKEVRLKNFLKCRAARRTAHTTGTIVGRASSGLLTMEGEQWYPLAEFEANGELSYASIFSMELRYPNIDKPAWGNHHVLLVPARYRIDVLRTDDGITEAQQQRLGMLRKQELACATADEWNRIGYERSFFSEMLPMGTEVTVTYDPDNPTNCEIVPYGEDDVFMGTSVSRLVLLGAWVLLVLGNLFFLLG